MRSIRFWPVLLAGSIECHRLRAVRRIVGKRESAGRGAGNGRRKRHSDAATRAGREARSTSVVYDCERPRDRNAREIERNTFMICHRNCFGGAGAIALMVPKFRLL